MNWQKKFVINIFTLVLVLGSLSVTMAFCEKTFEQLEKEIGFGAAVTMMKDKLPETFWKNLNYEQWQKIYFKTSTGDELEKKAIDKMVVLSADFDQYQTVYRYAYQNEQRKILRDKMVKSADNLKQWTKIYCHVFSAKDKDTLDKIKKEIFKLSLTFKSWKEVSMEVDDCDDDFDKIAISKMLGYASNFEECKQVYNFTYNHDQIKNQALQKMVEYAKTPEHWFQIYKFADRLGNLEIKKMAEEKIKG